MDAGHPPRGASPGRPAFRDQDRFQRISRERPRVARGCGGGPRFVPGLRAQQRRDVERVPSVRHFTSSIVRFSARARPSSRHSRIRVWPEPGDHFLQESANNSAPLRSRPEMIPVDAVVRAFVPFLGGAVCWARNSDISHRRPGARQRQRRRTRGSFSSANSFPWKGSSAGAPARRPPHERAIPPERRALSLCLPSARDARKKRAGSGRDNKYGKAPNDQKRIFTGGLAAGRSRRGRGSRSLMRANVC